MPLNIYYIHIIWYSFSVLLYNCKCTNVHRLSDQNHCAALRGHFDQKQIVHLSHIGDNVLLMEMVYNYMLSFITLHYLMLCISAYELSQCYVRQLNNLSAVALIYYRLYCYIQYNLT